MTLSSPTIPLAKPSRYGDVCSGGR